MGSDEDKKSSNRISKCFMKTRVLSEQRSSDKYVGTFLMAMALVYLAVISVWDIFDDTRQLRMSSTQVQREPDELYNLYETFRSSPKTSDVEQQQLAVQLVCSPETDWNEQRHSSDPYTVPTRTPSIFNCQHPVSGGRCRYFYPSNFFDPKCGLGKEFSYMVTDTEDRLRKRNLWKGSPRIGFNRYSFYFRIRNGRRIMVQDEVAQRKDSNVTSDAEQLYYETLSYIHVHKAGGTTVKDTFLGLASDGYGRILRLPWFHPRSALEIDQPKYEEALEVVQNGVRYPEKFIKVFDETDRDGEESEDDDDYDEEGTENVVFFTFVRDPVSRFISSIGQVMGSTGSQGHQANRFRSACLKPTPRETIACSLEYVKNQTVTGFDVHFAPQALDIAFTTMWQDIPVAVFSMEQSLAAVLQSFSEKEVIVGETIGNNDHGLGSEQGLHLKKVSPLRTAMRRRQRELGQNPRRSRKFNQYLRNQEAASGEQLRQEDSGPGHFYGRRRLESTDTVTTTTTMPILYRRNGTNPGYRPDPVLTLMSVKDYDSSLLHDVCQLYKVDVIMLQALGYPTQCNGVL